MDESARWFVGPLAGARGRIDPELRELELQWAEENEIARIVDEELGSLT